MRWLVLAAAVALVGCNRVRAYDLDGGDLTVAGAAFVQARGCPRCHQASDGSGTLAGDVGPLSGTRSFAGNLTPDRLTGLGAWADEQIVRAIRFGVDGRGDELCLTMPRTPLMGDVEARAIVAYLRSLPPVARAVPDSYCPPVKPQPLPDMAQPLPTDM